GLPRRYRGLCHSEWTRTGNRCWCRESSGALRLYLLWQNLARKRQVRHLSSGQRWLRSSSAAKPRDAQASISREVLGPRNSPRYFARARSKLIPDGTARPSAGDPALQAPLARLLRTTPAGGSAWCQYRQRTASGSAPP